MRAFPLIQLSEIAIDGPTDRPPNRQPDSQTARQKDRQTARQKDRQMNDMDGQGYGRTVEWTNRQTDLYTDINFNNCLTIVETYSTLATFYRECSYTAIFLFYTEHI